MTIAFDSTTLVIRVNPPDEKIDYGSETPESEAARDTLSNIAFLSSYLRSEKAEILPFEGEGKFELQNCDDIQNIVLIGLVSEEQLRDIFESEIASGTGNKRVLLVEDAIYDSAAILFSVFQELESRLDEPLKKRFQWIITDEVLSDTSI